MQPTHLEVFTSSLGEYDEVKTTQWCRRFSMSMGTKFLLSVQKIILKKNYLKRRKTFSICMYMRVSLYFLIIDLCVGGVPGIKLE